MNNDRALAEAQEATQAALTEIGDNRLAEAQKAVPTWIEARAAEQAAAAVIYDRFNKLWADADIPALVRQTPDREDGWQLLLAWVDRLQGRTSERPFRPSYDAIWRHQVHVFSHYLNLALGGVEGHSVRHAAIEEEGTRLVLDWWQGVKDARRNG